MPEVRPTRLLPPFWFLLAIATMVALHLLVPLAWVVPSPWNWLGLVPLLAGLGLTALAAGLFARRGTGIKPFSPTTVLVTDGPYRYTRNPMYLGLVLSLIGLAILLGTLSPWLVVPLFTSWIAYRFILQEEQMLADRFGEEYLRFKGRVRRWF